MSFGSIINENDILKYWIDNDTFKSSIDDNPTYIFYDGPPFATGLPHYGHILAGFIKDTIGRYQTQNSKSVPRKAGWDVHGLPIEYEIEKIYNIKTKQEIEIWGIDKYNQACRDIVMKYASEWDIIMSRMGRWIDFKNDYKTMDFDFMNSVWWVFSELANKKLVYPSYKVMPYSVACKTPLSNFETQQNYQDVEDTTLYVKFKLLEKYDADLLIWTTTPWTLPSNLVIAINTNIKYSIIESDGLYIIASSLINKVFGLAKKKYNIISEINGIELVGLKYEPLFNSYPIFDIRAFRIIHADYITETDGTGLVHIAPSYGNDDYEACLKYGIISKTDELFMSIDDQGYFIKDLKGLEDLEGIFYKNEGNTIIINKLKKSDKIYFLHKYKHSYPFCWRSDTPLMYRAVKSWFINVESIKDRMVELNKKINWVPSNIGENRFHNWLCQAKDWCVARNRYWGTPIPIWANILDPSDYIVIKSANELEKLCNLEPNTINDLHRDKIDHLTFELNGATYKRINEIFDCWFESGSMPYASVGYPYKTNSEQFKFPADFIAEGIDQTRGWFYTLLVISTALFDNIPFKNVIVNGLILASDGKKMSKRLKNYPDPMDVVNKFGSDALRLYLLNSPATKGDVLKFNEPNVQLMVKDIIIPLKNSVKFLLEYMEKFKIDYPNEVLYTVENYKTENPLDAYAIKYIGSLINTINNNLANYLLSDSIRNILNLIEMLNNQYIKFNRFAIKGKYNLENWKSSLSLLKILIEYIAINLAPLMPYFSEYIYQKFYNGSVHLTKFKNYKLPYINTQIDEMANEMKHVICIINLVMSIKSKNNLSMKTPFEDILIKSPNHINQILIKYSNFISDELNILNIKVDTFNWLDIDIDIKPNFNEIKKNILMNNSIEIINKTINEINLNNDDKRLLAQGVTINTIEPSMLNIIIKPHLINNYVSQYVYENNNNYCVYLNTIITDKIKELSYAKFIGSTFQKMRKNAGLHPWNPIHLGYTGNLLYPIENLQDCIYSVCNHKMNDLNNKEFKIFYEFNPAEIKEILNGIILYLYNE